MAKKIKLDYKHSQKKKINGLLMEFALHKVKVFRLNKNKDIVGLTQNFKFVAF